MEAQQGRRLWHIGHVGFSLSPHMSTACLLPATTIPQNTLVAPGRSTGRTNSTYFNISSPPLCSKVVKNKVPSQYCCQHNLGILKYFSTPLHHTLSQLLSLNLDFVLHSKRIIFLNSIILCMLKDDSGEGGS